MYVCGLSALAEALVCCGKRRLPVWSSICWLGDASAKSSDLAAGACSAAPHGRPALAGDGAVWRRGVKALQTNHFCCSASLCEVYKLVILLPLAR